MSNFWTTLRRRLLGISPEAIRFDRLGFRDGSPAARACLERIPLAFAQGYHAALEADGLLALVPRLERVADEQRGFAYEGAAMALALLDYLTPWRAGRVRELLAGAGAAHTYMVHVGVGWATARLRGNLTRARRRLDPLFGWLVADGYGFHEGFFHWRRFLGGGWRSAPFGGYEGRAFDQGFGRSLWFIEGANVQRVADRIEGAPAERRPDLWSGIGLAAVYAGGLGEEDLRALKQVAGPHWPALAQGAAFAAKARLRARTVVPYTGLACRVLCGLPVDAAARLTDSTLEGLPSDGPEPAYEIWRQCIQEAFTDATEQSRGR